MVTNDSHADWWHPRPAWQAFAALTREIPRALGMTPLADWEGQDGPAGSNGRTPGAPTSDTA
jgi:hypothetical protein